MARGGARRGAGRPAHRLKAENAVSLKVDYLARNGFLDEGNWNRLSWVQYGQKRLSSLIIARASHISVQIESFEQNLWLTKTPCHIGGYRRWFVCPSCSKPMGVLYLRNKRFACRTCQRISYQSQSGNAQDRIVWKYHSLQDTIVNWKLKRAARFNRTYDKYLKVACQFDAVVEAGLSRIAMAD